MLPCVHCVQLDSFCGLAACWRTSPRPTRPIARPRTWPTPPTSSSPRCRPTERQTASFAFDNVKERERFGFVPTEMHPRVGLTIEKMTEPQRQAAHNLLKAGLSQKGYMTASAIMELESILNLIENPPGSKPGKLERNPLKYSCGYSARRRQKARGAGRWKGTTCRSTSRLSAVTWFRQRRISSARIRPR